MINMGEIIIRPAAELDLPAVNRLLVQVHKIHNEARPDLFRPNRPEFSPDTFCAMLADSDCPIFVAEESEQLLGYVFCSRKQYSDHPILADVKTLSIDDLCVDKSYAPQAHQSA